MLNQAFDFVGFNVKNWLFYASAFVTAILYLGLLLYYRFIIFYST